MKKTLSMLLAIIMVFSMLPLSAYAVESDGQITFTTDFWDYDEVAVGDTFSVTAELSGNPGIASFSMGLEWDNRIVKFTGFEVDEDGYLDSKLFSKWEPVINHDTGYIVAFRTGNIKTNGDIFTANFEVIAGGDPAISMVTERSNNSKKFVFADENGTDCFPDIDMSDLEGMRAEGPPPPPFEIVINGEEMHDIAISTVDMSGAMGSEETPVYTVTVPRNATSAKLYLEEELQYTYYNSVGAYLGQDAGSWAASDEHTVAIQDKYSNPSGVNAKEEPDGELDGVSLQVPNEFAPKFLVLFVYAEGDEEVYTITVEQPAAGGTISANKITATEGEEVFVSYEAAAGYRFKHFLVNDEPAYLENGVLMMPAKDVVISAVFERTTYDVTVNTAQYGTVSADKTKAAAGDTVTLTVEPAEGYVLETLTVMYGETAVEVTNNAFAMPAGNVTVSATFKPEEPEVEPNPITEIEVSHPNIEVDETTGDMFMAMVSGASEQIDMSFTVADAELESSQIVFWSSSDDTVATVDQDGKITALKAGTVTITAKAVDASGIALLTEEEDVLAQITLTVADPAAGYTVNMGTDVEVVANETIQIPVTVTHTDSEVKNYKSFELEFQYDPTVLTLKNESSADEGKDVTIENKNGTIIVRRYGNALNVGDAAITLEFAATKTGNTNVKLTSAKVGTSDDAQNQNIPTAQIVDNLTKISVPGYTVKLPGEFEGERVIIPGEDYTFTAKDLNYNYTITATIGNQTLTVTGSGTEADPYKIAADQITGNIEITTEKSGKQFEITLNGESLAHESGYTVVDGKTYAQYMETYTAKLTKKDHYIYELKVTVNGADVEYDYNSETGLITIAGNLITGPVVIESGEQESEKHDVEFEGTYSSHAKYEGDSAVYDGEDFSFTIETPEGFVIESYEVSYKMGDAEEYTTLEATEGIYTVEDITAAVTIKIEGTSDRIVEVNEFVKLNGKTVFLVTATQTLPEGKNLAYNGNVMYLKNFAEEGADTMKQKYSYLVIIESGTLTVEEAAEMITVVEAESTILADTFNVNKSTALDINDAQLVYDLYNNVYQEIETVGMEKFLLADVNGSRNINVSDAAAVVGAIINPTA